MKCTLCNGDGFHIEPNKNAVFDTLDELVKHVHMCKECGGTGEVNPITLTKYINRKLKKKKKK